jgi:hypothetical protein
VRVSPLAAAAAEVKRKEEERKRKESEDKKKQEEARALGEECKRKRCAEAQHHARAAFSSLRSPL